MSAASCRGVVASIVLFLLAFAGGCGGGGGVPGDAALLTLVPSEGTLSPEFDPEVTGYDLGMVATPTLQWTPTARAIGSSITVQGVDVISGALSPSVVLPIGRSSITVVVTAADGVTRRTYTVSVDRTSAALTGLSTDAGPLSPDFEPGARDYVVGPLLATGTATLTATVLDPRATIAVNGVATLSGQPSAALPLPMGDTVVSVLVTAADGVTLALYTVVLVRTSAALSDLTISEGTLAPAFDPGVTAYGMGPTLLGPTVTVTPTAEAPNATITVNGVVVASGTASAPLPLPMGSSEVTVVVTAAGALATRTYQVVFDRTSAALTGLIASTGNLAPAFSDATYAYVVEAGLLPESTTLTPTAADPGAGLTIDGVAHASGAESDAISLAPGVNPLTVTVTARDGTQASYTVVVRRALAGQQAFLSDTADAGHISPVGLRVAIDGDTLAVSDLSGGGSSTHPGWVYVYVRVGTSWIQQAKLTASNPGAGDWFGKSVSLSGDTLVVGASQEDSQATGVGGNQADEGATDSGAAYVFVRNGTTWSQQAYLKASNTGASDWFGGALAISGDTLVVGSDEEDSDAKGVNGDQGNDDGGNTGAAYVFVRSGTTWTQEAYLKASNTHQGDGFGRSVAISGDTIVVGAALEDSGGTGVDSSGAGTPRSDSGAAYVFVRSGTTWSQQAWFKASNAGSGDRFGISVGVSGDVIVVGAHGENSGATGLDGDASDDSVNDAGAAYVFVRSGGTWTQESYLKAPGNGTRWEFGVAVAVSGDTVVALSTVASSGLAVFR